MKYSTSPPTSRGGSPPPPSTSSSTSLFFQSNPSLLPSPIAYKSNCISAATKCYKYLRKLLKFDQMDFEFAIWQIIFLLVSPQKVYRNFLNRKQTKRQFARDDPAFLVLLGLWLFLSSIAFAVVLSLNFFQFLKFIFYITIIDCIGVGLCVASLFWFLANHYFRHDFTQDVEWGYAFDIHLNASFPPVIILNIVHLTLYHSLISSDTFFALFFGNSIWFISISYYIYITFLGYTSTEILHRTTGILWAFPITFLIFIVFLCAGINVSRIVVSFYLYRIIT